MADVVINNNDNFYIEGREGITYCFIVMSFLILFRLAKTRIHTG